MDISTDKYRAGLVALAKQGRETVREIEAFLDGDNSNLSDEEYQNLQNQLVAKQKNAIDALATAMGMRPKSTLMQSEDTDINNIKRLAGITETNTNHTFNTMKKIVQLATNYMQNNKASAILTAKNIMFLADRIKDE